MDSPTSELRRKQRTRNLLHLGVFLVILLLPVVGMILGVDDRLNVENRNLAKPPEWSWDAEIIRAFPARFESYFDDHFGFRSWLIRTAKQVEWVYDRTRAGIAIGRDDWLYQGKEAELASSYCVQLEGAALRSWEELGRNRQQWFERRGIAFLWAMAPNKHTLYPEHLPETVAVPGDAVCRGELLSKQLGREAGVDFLDLRPVLLEAKAAHRVYHRTDTHWNQLGAFFGARAILKQVRARFPQVSEPSLEEFEVRRIFDEYGGNLSSLLSIYGLRFPEERYALAPHRGFVARPTEGTPPIDPSWSGHRMKRLVMATGRPELPTAVMVHDSFGYALMPFIAEHFERTVFLHSSGSLDFPAIAAENPDLVIALFVEAKLRHPPPRDLQRVLLTTSTGR
jgi:hypothetical protein